MAICLSHAGTASYSSNSPSDKLLIGTGNGVYTIQRQGPKEWRVAEKSLEGSHVSTLFAKPASGLIFTGIYKGGVLASADSGRSWERWDQSLTEKDVCSL